MRTYNALMSLTATAAAMLTAGDLIGFDDAPVVVEDQPIKGVVQNPATEIGMDVAVTAIGMETVTAAVDIMPGDKLVSATGGGVRAAIADDENVFAIALSAAAAGARVQILIR